MSEDMERQMPESDIGQTDEAEDVEGHKHIGARVPEDKVAATEEGPDVEGHLHHPKAPPKAAP